MKVGSLEYKGICFQTQSGFLFITVIICIQTLRKYLDYLLECSTYYIQDKSGPGLLFITLTIMTLIMYLHPNKNAFHNLRKKVTTRVMCTL